MDAFEYHASPSTVIFGSGTVARLSGLLEKQGLCRPIILCTPSQVHHAEAVRRTLDGSKSIAGIFSEATMHTPVEVTERAISAARAMKADSVVSVGGGSTIGLGKALSFRTEPYHVAIPPTYAGSEVTPILGETAAGVKQTRADSRILPAAVIYDVDLTLDLPVGMSLTSAINAIAHAPSTRREGNPIIDMFAQKGVQALAEALPRLLIDAHDVSARSTALYGAWLCGLCLGNGGMSLHHKLCHTLGGSFGLPHSETHAVVLPHVLSYNTPRIPRAVKLLADVLPDAEGDAVRGLKVLLRKLGVERRLEALGFREEDIDRAADIAVLVPYLNPREIKRDEIREVIRRAWAGEEARADF